MARITRRFLLATILALSVPYPVATAGDPVAPRIPQCPGDINQDGVVNFADLPLFVNCVLTGGDCARADMNQDGLVNGRDVQEFIHVLLAGGACP